MADQQSVMPSSRVPEPTTPGADKLQSVSRIGQRAERIAGSITKTVWKAEALAGFAQTMAATDPDRARDLADRAEKVAQSAANESASASALARVARVTAATNPERAEELAVHAEVLTRSIPNEADRASALLDLAQAAAAIILTGRYS